jgi:hypothetical protein
MPDRSSIVKEIVLIKQLFWGQAALSPYPTMLAIYLQRLIQTVSFRRIPARSYLIIEVWPNYRTAAHAAFFGFFFQAASFFLCERIGSVSPISDAFFVVDYSLKRRFLVGTIKVNRPSSQMQGKWVSRSRRRLSPSGASHYEAHHSLFVSSLDN